MAGLRYGLCTCFVQVEKLREAMASFKAVKRERLITESFRKLLGAEDAKKYTAEQIDAKIKSLEAGKGK